MARRGCATSSTRQAPSSAAAVDPPRAITMAPRRQRRADAGGQVAVDEVQTAVLAGLERREPLDDEIAVAGGADGPADLLLMQRCA